MINLQDIKLPTVRDVKLAKARKSHLEFVKHCWMNTGTPFLTGFHTRKISERIDRAFKDFRKGKSTYLMVKVPFRHGK